MAGTLTTYWWVLALAGAAALAYAFGLSRDAQVARRLFVQFFGTIVAPLVVVFGLVLAALSWLFDFDERVWAAVIAGLVIASGWLTSAIFAELGKSRGRAERLRDYHKALYAEIGNTLATLWDGWVAKDGERVMERMRADAEFVPFIPREHNDHVYNAVVEEIDVLPRQTIDAIVAYYSLIKSIATLADDMRGEQFRLLPQARRLPIYEDYLKMREQAHATGQYALKLISAFSDGGKY